MKSHRISILIAVFALVLISCVPPVELAWPEPTLSEYLAVAKPGNVFLIRSGTYKGAGAMLHATDLKGTADKPIVIKAQVDGAVTLDGEGKYIPIFLERCEYVIIEGFNACNSVGTVVGLKDSKNCIIRRVCAWEAAEGNYKAYQILRGEGNLIEDCAGWGRARKIFAVYKTKNNTFRRCWGRWEGSITVGPKLTYTAAYNAYGTLLDTCVGTWDARRMPETYTLLAGDGTPWTGNGAGVYTDHKVNQPVAVFGVDANQASQGYTLESRCAMRNCVAYVKTSQRCDTVFGFFVAKINQFQVIGCSAFLAGELRPFMLSDKGEQVKAEGLYAGGTGKPYVGRNWGDAVFGDTPVLPASWPMNQRIKELAGEDVEAVLDSFRPAP